MKKFIAILLVIMLVVVLTIPASAAGINWGAAHDAVSGAVTEQIRLNPNWIFESIANLFRGWM